MYTGLSRDHTRRKSKILRNHLVHPFILQMWKLRPRGGLTCPRSHSPSGAGLQLGLHAGSPGPSAPDGSCGPRLSPAQGQPRKPERKSPRPGVAAAFRPDRRLGPGPGRCEARASTAAPDPPTCRGPHNGQPHPLPGPGARPASTAASSGGSARRGYAGPEAAGVTSGGRWARGGETPARLGHAGDADAAGLQLGHS